MLNRSDRTDQTRRRGRFVTASSRREAAFTATSSVSTLRSLFLAPMMSGEPYDPLRPPPRPFAGAGGSGGASLSERSKSILFLSALTSAVSLEVRTSP